MHQTPQDQQQGSRARAAFGRELAHWRELRGKTQAGLARRLVEEGWIDECGQSYIAHVEAGRKPAPKGMAEGADAILETGGTLARLWTWVEQERAALGRLSAAARADTIVAGSISVTSDEQEASPVPTRRELFGYLGAGVVAAGIDQARARLGAVAPGLVEALDVYKDSGVSDLGPGTLAGLQQALDHYATSFPASPPDELYDEVLQVRRMVASMLDGRATVDEHRELVVVAGWLSALLGLLCFDRGEHAAVRVWCEDARARGVEAGHAELAAWSREPMVLVAFYVGRPEEAAAAAREGLALAPKGSGAEAKLAAQQMRALAAVGDRRRFLQARRRTERAYAKLPAADHLPGKAFVPGGMGDRPPLLGTSMVLAGDWSAAEQMKREELGGWADHDTPGRSIGHLDRGIALAHLDRLDEAAAAGIRALTSKRLVGSVLVQAGKLDGVLTASDAMQPHVRAFHERYVTRPPTHEVVR